MAASIVILEPPKIKPDTVSTVSPSICREREREREREGDRELAVDAGVHESL